MPPLKILIPVLPLPSTTTSLPSASGEVVPLPTLTVEPSNLRLASPFNAEALDAVTTLLSAPFANETPNPVAVPALAIVAPAGIFIVSPDSPT